MSRIIRLAPLTEDTLALLALRGIPRPPPSSVQTTCEVCGSQGRVIRLHRVILTSSANGKPSCTAVYTNLVYCGQCQGRARQRQVLVAHGNTWAVAAYDLRRAVAMAGRRGGKAWIQQQVTEALGGIVVRVRKGRK